MVFNPGWAGQVVDRGLSIPALSLPFRSSAPLQAFLEQAAKTFASLEGADRITVYDAVPLTVVKVFNVHRAQLLLECASRAVLQGALRAWQPALRGLKVKGLVRWNVEVDPLDI